MNFAKEVKKLVDRILGHQVIAQENPGLKDEVRGLIKQEIEFTKVIIQSSNRGKTPLANKELLALALKKQLPASLALELGL